jgi:hypothetical protein
MGVAMGIRAFRVDGGVLIEMGVFASLEQIDTHICSLFGGCKSSDWFLDDSWGYDKAASYSTLAGTLIVVIENDYG